MAQPQYENVPARWYVATYGDMGIEIQLFDDPLEYGRAVRRAKRDWERGYNDFGEIDTYTMGDCSIMKRIAA